MRSITTTAATLAAVMIASAPAPAQPRPTDADAADLVVINANIVTMDGARPRAGRSRFVTDADADVSVGWVDAEPTLQHG